MRSTIAVRIGWAVLGGTAALALVVARLLPLAAEAVPRQIGLAWTVTALLVQM